MLEIRFHGRGGQGTVNGAQMLAKAVVKAGRYAQFIPAFGVERKGSPVYGYFRMSDEVIWPKTQVYYPDGLVIMDDSLYGAVPLYEGLKTPGFVVLNTKKDVDQIPVPPGKGTLVCLDATGIARSVIGAEIPNTVMLGALTKALPELDRDILAELIEQRYGQKNKEAFLAGIENAKVTAYGEG